MSRIRLLTTTLLLAIWPAVIVHCGLESAGIEVPVVVHHHHHDGGDDHGHDDHSAPPGSHPEEDLSLQGVGTGLKVSGPHVWFVVELIPTLADQLAGPRTFLIPRCTKAVCIIRTWHFEQRAVWPARAPNFRA